MSEYQLEVGQYDDENNTITYYGREAVLNLNGEGGLESDFDGTWICLNGQPLYVEIVSSTPSATEYKAHVNYDGDEAYLMISCDRDTGETSYVEGKKITYTAGTSVTRELLPQGYYLTTAVISDSRGDNYYSTVVGATVSGKSIGGWTLDENFIGRDY